VTASLFILVREFENRAKDFVARNVGRERYYEVLGYVSS
jgi:hypothetical protein